MNMRLQEISRWRRYVRQWISVLQVIAENIARALVAQGTAMPLFNVLISCRLVFALVCALVRRASISSERTMRFYVLVSLSLSLYFSALGTINGDRNENRWTPKAAVPTTKPSGDGCRVLRPEWGEQPSSDASSIDLKLKRAETRAQLWCCVLCAPSSDGSVRKVKCGKRDDFFWHFYSILLNESTSTTTQCVFDLCGTWRFMSVSACPDQYISMPTNVFDVLSFVFVKNSSDIIHHHLAFDSK